MTKQIELLSPAGDMERLKMSLAYGADAVYLAGNDFGMRAFAGNFTPDEMRQAVELCHSKGVSIHVTCNTMPRNDEVARLPEWLEYLQDLGVDGLGLSRAEIILPHLWAPMLVGTMTLDEAGGVCQPWLLLLERAASRVYRAQARERACKP